MKIVNKDIIINSENISDFRNVKFLTSGEYAPKWNALGDIDPLGDVIYLYRYHIDSGLNLSPSDELYQKIKNSNEELPYSLVHEKQHAHNEDLGFSFNLIDGVCYTYIVLYILNELSARMAANLFRIPQDRRNQGLYMQLKGLGMDIQDRALFIATTLFDEENLCSQYAYIGASAYICCINSMCQTGKKERAYNIMSKQIPLHADYSKYRELYSEKFYSIARKYFEFNGIKIKEQLCPFVQQNIYKQWQRINPMIFDTAQQCIGHIYQNVL